MISSTVLDNYLQYYFLYDNFYTELYHYVENIIEGNNGEAL